MTTEKRRRNTSFSVKILRQYDNRLLQSKRKNNRMQFQLKKLSNGTEIIDFSAMTINCMFIEPI